MSRDNHWNKPRRPRGRNWSAGNQGPRPPPGLRGAEIGLYYKNLSLMKKKKTEHVINLKIPSSVLSLVDKNLLTIAKIAARDNISLPQLKKTDSIVDDNASVKNKIKSNERITDKMKEIKQEKKSAAGPSSALDFIAINQEAPIERECEPKVLALRKMSDYKYGYEDIITGTFDEKLDECLSKGINVNLINNETQNLNAAFYVEYQDMIERSSYKKLLKFREQLPAFKKAREIFDTINDNQVIVISGETGCGKSTQVPQIILDNAILANKGANVKILVTQPRRIAASSLAMRVANERGESLGNSVGYVVRLEKCEERARGSIRFCTTGVLLADLEVNQGLTDFSHIILDEVHERDVHVDISMCMLRQVLKKRKDLKLILMSATLDAESLSAYFGKCPLMHIEGLAYPVEDVYLEDILRLTNFRLPEERPRPQKPKWMKYRNRGNNRQADEMEREIRYRAEIAPWLESKKRDLPTEVYKTLQDCRTEELNLELIVELLIYISKCKPGAILVFLPGIGEITKVMNLMRDSNCFPQSRFEIYPLHSKLATLEQHRIFERPPDHIRKIIIATNIAETSITIDDVVYVVDCGKIKISGLNVEKNVSTLQIEWVSKANLHQRRGRAGRCQPGICYHLLTSFRAEKLPERLLPELQRSNLLEPVLMIKRLRLGMAEDALKLVVSPPAESTIQWAVKHLQKCGALDDKETLTPLGWHLARLPVHPAAGKLLLLGALFGCLDRAASVAAVWSFKDPFLLVIGKEKEVDRAKRNLTLGEPSDHVAVSEAIMRWESCPQRHRRSFAYENFLSHNTLELLADMKRQLADNLRQMGFLNTGNIKSSWENRNADNMSLFKAIVAASLYPNVAHVKWTHMNKLHKAARFVARNAEDGRLNVHPSSVMSPPKEPKRVGVAVQLCNNPGANWLVYWLKQRTSDLFILDVTLIYTLPLLFFGEFLTTDDIDPETCLLSVSNIKVRCKKESANKLFELRGLLDKVLASKVTDSTTHSTRHNEFEENVLNTVIQLITAEDEQVEYLDDDMPESDNSESETDRNY